MAQKPEWANRRNVGGAWFAHDEQVSTEKQRYRLRTFEGADEFKKWDYLKGSTDTTQWKVERGGNKWEKPGLPRRRKKDAINPDAARIRNKVKKEKAAQRVLEQRRVELSHQDKPHGYKDIISWEQDRLLAENPRKPIRPNKPILRQNREGRVERMTKETASEMRSSRNRFFCEPRPDPVRQAKLQASGLYHPRKASILGNSADHHNVIDSYGTADALTHSVYGGKALKPEWDLAPTQPTQDWNAPKWYGQNSHVKSTKAAPQPKAPKWWPEEKK